MYAASADEIGLVITDISMPRMDGVGLVRALKQINPSAKVIAMTGMASDAKIEEMKSLGVERMIHKPCNAQMILRAMKEILAG